MSHKARKRWALVVLLIGLPVYIFVANEIFVRATLENNGRLAVGWELIVVVAIGVLWVLPLKWLFIGVGQADPDSRDD
ncbi:MAG: DUF2842 domain-containing protein [Paracoccaceae bacterium]|nr:DUF2842 domain-containing protein [Loktanella sp.]